MRASAGSPSTQRDPLIAALARYVEALHRRYPEGPDQLRRAGLDGRAKATARSSGCAPSASPSKPQTYRRRKQT